MHPQVLSPPWLCSSPCPPLSHTSFTCISSSPPHCETSPGPMGQPQVVLGIPRTCWASPGPRAQGDRMDTMVQRQSPSFQRGSHRVRSAPAPSLPTWLHPGEHPGLLPPCNPSPGFLLPSAEGSWDNGWRDQESWWGQRSHCRQRRGHGGERHGQRSPSFSQAPHPAAEPAVPLAAGAVPPALCWLRVPASRSQDTGD